MVVGIQIVSWNAFSLDIIYIIRYWPPTPSTRNHIKIRCNTRIVSVVLFVRLLLLLLYAVTHTRSRTHTFGFTNTQFSHHSYTTVNLIA